jgi:hypothetical protein
MIKLTVSFLVLLLVPGVVQAKGYEVKKNVGGYAAEIRIDKNPLVLGDNNIEIEIRDPEGNNVTDAKVLVNYYMPPMPRMIPMNYRTDAKLSKDRYRAKMNLIMSGPWIVAIIITHDGKTRSAKINLDAQ